MEIPKEILQSVEPEKIETPQERLLPINEYRDSIVEQIRNNPTTIVMGETGSGKTTEIPQFLLDEFPDKKIAVTEPRRIATRAIPEYIAKKRNVKIGEEIGYKMRFEDVSQEGTRLNFVTDGLLLQEIKGDPLLLKFDVVMIDEAHERSLNIDFLLGMLKKAQTTRKEKGEKELKIIVTSATLEKEKFATYFNDSPAVEVPGRIFPVEVVYKNVETSKAERGREKADYPKTAANLVREIIGKQIPGDILIFMPREQEIVETEEILNELKKMGYDMEVLPLYGRLGPDQQRKVFEKFPRTKVVIATNIAETSITIDGVTSVIDSGLINEKDFDPATGIESMDVRNHAQSGCDQRKGRAGRTAPGTCYRLYDESSYALRRKFQEPEISRSNLDHTVLMMKKMGISDVMNFDFIEPPEKESMIHAIKTLKMLGALDEKEQITDVGNQMVELPLSPEKSRMLIEAEKYGCVESVCTIAAMLSDKALFFRPKDPKEEFQAKMIQERFKDADSDFITLLNVWKEWEASGYDYGWAKKHYLNARQLVESREVRFQLMGKLKALGITASDNGGDTNHIKKAISSGMVQNFMRSEGFRSGYQKIDEEEKVNLGFLGYRDNGENVFIHPGSSVFSSSPEYMVGSNVVKTSKRFARLCQKLEPEWIPELAPTLFSSYEKKIKFSGYMGSGKIVEHNEYVFENSGRQLVFDTKVGSENSAALEMFIDAIIDGRINNGVISENRSKIRILEDLRDRTGGKITVPDLREWYASKINNTVNSADLEEIADEIRIDLDQFYNPEFRMEIEKKYPTFFTVDDDLNVHIQYGYRMYSGTETYEATIIIPQNDIDYIEPEDIPEIGENGRPRVLFRSDYGSVTGNALFNSLKELQDATNKKLIERKSATESQGWSTDSYLYQGEMGRPGSYFRPEEDFTNSEYYKNMLAQREIDREVAKKNRLAQKEAVKAAKEPKIKDEDIVMTPELHTGFNEELTSNELIIEKFIEIIQKTDLRTIDVEKLKLKLKDLRKKFTEEKKKMEGEESIPKIKSTIGNQNAEKEKIMKEFKRLGIINENFGKDTKKMMFTITEMAKQEKLTITPEKEKIIKKRVVGFSMKEHTEAEILTEIEKIVFEELL